MMIGIEINSVAEIPVIVAGTAEQKGSFLGRMIAEPLQVHERPLTATNSSSLQ